MQGLTLDPAEDAETNPVCQAARLRERARCAAIFGSKHAAGRTDMAASLAFETTLSRSKAIGVLAAAAAGEPYAGGRGSLYERMAGMEALRPGQEAPDRGGASPGAGWAASARRVGVLPAVQREPHGSAPPR